MKPSCIIDYNKSMGGINNIDKQLSLTETTRKSMKWYKKLFFHLLDLVLINAHAMYNLNNERLSFPGFRLQIVLAIFNLKDKPDVTIQARPTRLVGRHFPIQLEKKRDASYAT